MVTVVATWDHQKEQGQIHLTLESSLFDLDARLEGAEQKVRELESLVDTNSVEVILAHARTLDEFKRTDPRFL